MLQDKLVESILLIDLLHTEDFISEGVFYMKKKICD